MGLRSVYGKTLREGRLAVVGWGVGMGLLLLAVQATVGSVMGAPGAKQALASMTESFRWAADPVAVTTVGGYATWKLGFTVLMMAMWPLIASARVLRGAEERGSMDVLLSVPRGRLRVALESVAAVWTDLLAMALLASLIGYLGGLSAHAGYTLVDALLYGLNLALICGVFGSLALAIGQFTERARTAAGAAGGLLFAFIVLDMLHRTIPGTTWLSALSPVYYYNLSKPLVPSFGTDAWAMLMLVAISVALTGVAVALFVGRDVGSSVRWFRRTGGRPRTGVRQPAQLRDDWSLRSLYARGLAMIVAPTLWWTLGIAGFAAFTIVATKQLAGQLQTLIADSPQVRLVLAAFGGGGTRVNEALLGALFAFLPVLIMVFAVTQATRWAADEEAGRQDLVLSTPRARHRVLLARYATVATAGLFIGLATLVAVDATSAAVGLSLRSGHLTAAVLSIVPQCLLMAAVGYLFGGWLAAALESGLLSFLLALWFFISFIGPELGWPPVVQRLSAFYYYGTPLLDGLAVGNVLVVLGASAVLLAGASIRYMRKDIGRLRG